MTSSWFFLSTLNYDARSTTHQIYSRYLRYFEKAKKSWSLVWRSTHIIASEMRSINEHNLRNELVLCVHENNFFFRARIHSNRAGTAALKTCLSSKHYRASRGRCLQIMLYVLINTFKLRFRLCPCNCSLMTEKVAIFRPVIIRI